MKNIKLWRDEKGYAKANIESETDKHSPTGFEWGYGGSGPANLALNIMLKFVDGEVPNWLYQEFKRDFLVPMPEEGGTIKAAEIIEWLKDNNIEVKQ